MKKIALFMFGMFATCSTFAQEYLQINSGELIPVDKIKSITYRVDNTMLSDIISSNTEATIFAEAIEKTGISKLLSNCIDKSYKGSSYAKEIMYSDPGGRETAQRPNQRLEGYTAFLVPDATLEKMDIRNLKDLYGYACKVYDEMYPEDVNAPGHSYDNLTDPVNPLYRLIAYHIIDRNVQSYDCLTTRYDLGVATDKVNPTNWYTTLLPGTMLKVERLTCDNCIANMDDVRGDRYINRRVDAEYRDVFGAHIINADATANNGLYFYVDGILAFDKTTRDIVDNCRIRMDMSDVLPELASNNIRWNGYPYIPVEGINYYLPDGYLKNCSLKGEPATLVYRYPRAYSWNAHGDEMRLLGVFDFTMQLPPFPFEGEWQIRLGYSADSYSNRATVDVYFDDTKVQEALDGSLNSGEGYMPGPYSILCKNSSDGYGTPFSDIKQNIRKILCTVDIDKSALNKPHTLRLVNVGKLLATIKNWSLDYIELVPKSVYDGNEDNY